MQNMWVSDCYQCQVNFFQLYHCISWLEKVYEEMICIREKTLPSWTCIIIAPWNYWYRCAALFIMLYRKQANKSLFLLLIILRSSKYSLWFDTMSIMDQTNKFLHSSLKSRMVTNSSPYNMMNNYYHMTLCAEYLLYFEVRLLYMEQLQ